MISPDSIPALVVALALAALIAAWAEAHFNEGQPLGEIRYSVPQQRYFAALSVHVAAILGLYVLFLVAVYGAIMLGSGGLPQFDCYRFDLSEPCKQAFNEARSINSDALLWSALASALFLRLFMPNVAITSRFLDRVRDQTHDLALFPFARQSLLAALSTSKFEAGQDSDAELRNHLSRYGVDWGLISFVSPSAKRALVEACSLRQRLTDLLNPLQGLAPVLWPEKVALESTLLPGGLRPAEEIEFSSSRIVRKFGATRAMAFAQLETDFRRLMRRTALALLLAEEISEKIESDALYRAISNFVAEECDDVLPRYRSLVGEAALSCVSHRAKRAEFLKSFGYDVPTPPALPLYPWVVVFLLDFLLFLIPPLVMLYLGGQNPNSKNRAPRAVRRRSCALANGRAYLGHLSKDCFELRAAITLFLAVAILRRLRFCVVRDGCQHSLYVSACLSDSVPDRPADIGQFARLPPHDGRIKFPDRPPIAVGLARFRAGPDRRWIDPGGAHGEQHADFPGRHLLSRTGARLVGRPQAAVRADPSALPGAFGGAGLCHGLFRPIRDRRVHAEGASTAVAGAGRHSRQPAPRLDRKMELAGDINARVTDNASLDELLVKIKDELTKLAPLIDLEVVREPQGSRIEGGSSKSMLPASRSGT